MKEALKIWSKEEFGNLLLNLKKVEEKSHLLDLQAKNGTILLEDKLKRNDLKAETWKLSRHIERMWLQKWFNGM